MTLNSMALIWLSYPRNCIAQTIQYNSVHSLEIFSLEGFFRGFLKLLQFLAPISNIFCLSLPPTLKRGRGGFINAYCNSAMGNISTIMDKDMMEPAARRCKSLYSDGEQREGFDINQTARKKQDPQPCHWSIKKNEISSRITE